jgi:hypothetical protein
MRTAISHDVTRHRLLEGALLRMARLPEADGFVLRGGMLMRHWFRPLPRPVGDLDLVATFPFGVDEVSRRFLPILADTGVADGVLFDPERSRVEGIWLHTESPGVRVFAGGEADGEEGEFSVDITFTTPLVPAPTFGELPTTRGGPARVWMSRPESVTAQKLQALRYMGMLHWRPKDLNDLRLLLARVPMDEPELLSAIAASFAFRGFTSDDARGLFAPSSWWGMKMSSARWLDFVKAARGLDVPRALTAVVAEVAGRLAPILERLP